MARHTKKKSNMALIIAAIAALAACAAVLAFTRGTPDAGTDGTVQPAAQTAGAVEATDTVETAGAAETNATAETAGADKSASSQEDLTIQIGELSAVKAAFYPVEVEGTQMEVIAVLDENGAVRTAFNTCQVCYSSGRGYYKQVGPYLICQNCLNRFSMDQVGVEYGGCNPWPIFESDRVDTEETVTIPYAFLQSSTKIFANWKTDY